MNQWSDRFRKHNIFYITPDVKRGIGLESLLPNYHIICTYHDPLIPILRRQGANIFCLNEKIGLQSDFYNNSGKLLENKLVKEYIHNNSQKSPCLLFFKPSIKIDLLCQTEGYKSLVNCYDFNDKFENKIKFFHHVEKYFPEFHIPGISGILNNLKYKVLVKQLGLPFVVQFAHGWAGKTTFLISNEKDFFRLASKFQKSTVKANKFIYGFTVLNNACIYNNQVLVSPPAIQISNIPKLLEKPGVTCGRQWPVKYLEEKQIKIINTITGNVGLYMNKIGFKGFFGLDFLIDKKDGRVYLSENNARFTASTSFYTKLELGINSIPLTAYHLASFLGLQLPILSHDDSGLAGSQIIFRKPEIDSKLFPRIEYGVFKTAGNKVLRSDYYPQNLAEDEFIFSRRLQKSIKGEDLELSRLECKQEVLESVYKLKLWVNRMII